MAQNQTGKGEAIRVIVADDHALFRRGLEMVLESEPDIDVVAEANDGNIVYSPASIHLALAMTYAGARGDTAAEMREALHFDLDGDVFHQAMNTLDQALAGRNREEPPGPDDVDIIVVSEIIDLIPYCQLMVLSLEVTSNGVYRINRFHPREKYFLGVFPELNRIHR